MSDSKWEVKVVRTNFGDVIAEVDANEGAGPYLTLQKPAIIRVRDNGKGGFGVELAPFMIYSDDESFSIDRINVVCIANPVAELRNIYSSAMGSGIVVPSTPTIPPSVGQSILLKS